MLGTCASSAQLKRAVSSTSAASATSERWTQGGPRRLVARHQLQRLSSSQLDHSWSCLMGHGCQSHRQSQRAYHRRRSNKPGKHTQCRAAQIDLAHQQTNRKNLVSVDLVIAVVDRVGSKVQALRSAATWYISSQASCTTSSGLRSK